MVLGGWVPYTVNATGGAVHWTAPPAHSPRDRVLLCRATGTGCAAARAVGGGTTG